mgnify:CR=1 FL=1
MQDGTKCQIVKVCHSTHTSALSDKYFAQSTLNLKPILYALFLVYLDFILICENLCNLLTESSFFILVDRDTYSVVNVAKMGL